MKKLQHFSDSLWVVENVDPYYVPLYPPVEYSRHCFWMNYNPPMEKDYPKIDLTRASIKQLEKFHGVTIPKIKGVDRRQVLRNGVYPEIGLDILGAAFQPVKTIEDWLL